ncbi:alpha/beta hydrolase [Curtobacterium pusillum]|uniref:alpha/beta hydrolase n=1 Tax=Curtobacterium pusillum TaxID=69373 RepID=UPI0011A0D991|nr:alpha/beta hydrolase [Curtobacterium pusillum]
MAGIEFDGGVARKLITTATAADDRLRASGSSRRYATEDAVVDFSGAYAKRFTAASEAEAADRVRLARALDSLAEQVQVVVEQAQRERARREALADWRRREDERRRAAASNTLAPFGIDTGSMFDPKPSETPIRPTPISASFAASDRPRNAGATSSGRSSADPDRLRAFAASSRVGDIDLGATSSRLRAAWAAFTMHCAWATVDSTTLFRGFERYLQENAADADWVERIAEAFERAGSGRRLPNAVLDVAAAATIPASFRKLLAAGVSPAKAARIWSGLGFARDGEHDLAALPVSVLSMLGNLEGIPYWVRNTANRTVLAARLRRRNLDPVEKAALQNIRAALRPNRFLIALTADVPPLAAVSIGDLDAAENVTWAVPGMGSSTLRTTEWVDSAQNVYAEQVRIDQSRHAVIAWIGYVAPPIPSASNPDFGVLNEKSAAAGARKLAASIRGLTAARADGMPRTNVLGHSYGTTTASLALTKSGVRVDSFTSIASAGIPRSIGSATDLHADYVYAGQAQNTMVGIPGFGDQFAYIGRDFSFPNRKDPTASAFGAKTFGADGHGDLKPVTDHGVHTASGNGYLDRETESIRNVAFTTTGHGHRVTGPTR